MAVGPGKYDDLATTVREQAHAAGVIVIVIGGDKGEGFAMQADVRTMLALPQMLRHIADQIEQDTTNANAEGIEPQRKAAELRRG
jgi:hypothetical protein